MNINEYRVKQMKAEFIRKFRQERRSPYVRQTHGGGPINWVTILIGWIAVLFFALTIKGR